MTHSRRRPTRRSRKSSANPIVGFILVVLTGFLFTGCASQERLPIDEYTFTAEDLQQAAEISDAQEEVLTGTTGTESTISAPSTALAPLNPDVELADPAVIESYNAIRSPITVAENTSIVTNEFVNVRSEPSSRSTKLAVINQGETIAITGYHNAAWAEVDLGEEGKGYVSTSFVGRLLAESAIEAFNTEFEGQYFVDFQFLNVRAQADKDSAKLGVLDSQQIIRPLDNSNGWARIAFDGKEGYVADEYLEPFKPSIVVRQDQYTLPVLHYRLIQDGMLAALSSHIDTLKNAGYSFSTFKDFSDLLSTQQDQDVRLEPKQVIIAVSDITKDDLATLQDVLSAAGVPATVFIQTRHIGLENITESDVQALVASGLDIQAGGHIGDDLRSLTNAQVQVELAQSKAMLEGIIGREINAIAYPRGGVNDRILAKVIEAGFLTGLGSQDGITFKREELLDMPSLFISSSLSGEDVLSLIQP